MNPLEILKKLSKEAHLLHSTSFLLEWDQETHMPSGSIAHRSEQKELLASLIHEKKTSSEFEKALSQIIEVETGKYLIPLNDFEKKMVKEWRRDFLLATKLPSEHVRAFAKATSSASSAWTKAKENDDFPAFLPFLEENVELIRKQANYLGYEDHPYDALIDCYEPEMTTRKLKDLFAHLKPQLIEILDEIKKKSLPDDSFLHEHYDKDGLWNFSYFLMEKMGIDKQFSRLDHTAHPFCISDHPQDVRLTTHIQCNNPMGNIGAVIHEGGHALYQLGLPVEHYGTPLCEAISLGIHESQSRFWETIIGQSYPFWNYFYPKLQATFTNLKSISLDQFYAAINLVKSSLIRIYSDEVTYCLHIILRFELELALLEKKLEVRDLPQAWNAKMDEYLGLIPPSNREGCLQDIHWSLGLIGYFPTYALGNIYAAQFFETMKKENTNWEDQIKSGDLLGIRDWLKSRIHIHGKFYRPEELLKKVTGEPLNTKYYINYLKSKYLSI